VNRSLRQLLISRWAKPVVFLLCLVPFGYLAWASFALFRGRDLPAYVGAEPVAFLQHSTGDWTLRFLLITLSVTPLRRLLNLPDLIRFRRMFGLFAFFYVCLHFLTYIGPDQAFDFAAMLKDVAKRPFITVGFAGLLLLVPLAITSTKAWIRRLGGKNWQLLHRLVYIAALCGVVHYYWLVKSDHRLPLLYASLLALLLLYRVADSLKSSSARPLPAPDEPRPAS